MSAGEAFPVPRIISVGHTTLGNHLAALDALGRKFFFITFCTINVVLLWDETLGSNGVLAGAADEALLVPLPGLVLHLLHARLKHVAAAVAPGRELGVVTGAAVNTISLGTKLFIHQAGSTFVTKETSFMPMFLLVRQVLGVNADDLATFVAVVGEHVLVALDAVRMIVPQDIPVASKAVVAMVTEHDCFFFNFGVLVKISNCPLNIGLLLLQ